MIDKFFELDLSFLDEKASDDETGQSIIAVDLPPVNPSSTAPPIASTPSTVEEPAST